MTDIPPTKPGPDEATPSGSVASDVPAIPKPFRPAEPLVGPGSGCGTPIVVGCGMTVLVLLIGVGLVLSNSQKLIGWAFSQSRQALLEKMPEDLPVGERQRFERAFDGAVEAVVDQKLDQKGLQTLSNELRDAVINAGDGTLTSDEVKELTLSLEDLVEEHRLKDAYLRDAIKAPFFAAGKL